MHSLKQGILIAVEGIDGSGKSTLVKHITEQLSSQLPIIATKEPGGTPLGKQLRTLVQERTVPLCSKAEYLLFATDRAQHFDELIIPALANNKIVISDRMADSSLIYQGYGRGLDMNIIKTVNTWAMNAIQPHITLYVRITPNKAYQRLIERNQKLTSFEQEKREFFEQLALGFDTIYTDRPDVVWLDGSKNPTQIAQEAISSILTRLKPFYRT